MKRVLRAYDLEILKCFSITPSTLIQHGMIKHPEDIAWQYGNAQAKSSFSRS
jgi:hypothetical protein